METDGRTDVQSTSAGVEQLKISKNSTPLWLVTILLFDPYKSFCYNGIETLSKHLQCTKYSGVLQLYSSNRIYIVSPKKVGFLERDDLRNLLPPTLPGLEHPGLATLEATFLLLLLLLLLLVLTLHMLHNSLCIWPQFV